ncbi:MAG: YciI family protein [Woeseiaceae bacterium]|nr:YciI family protein [Woeseiaceae bacterium]
MAKHAPTVPRLDERVFLVVAYDGPDSEATRDDALEGHLDYIERHCERYLACGPLHAPDRSRLIGSFFLVSASDADDARRFLNGDPYLDSGMYASIDVHEATVAGGRWMGGVIWESAEQVRAAQS